MGRRRGGDGDGERPRPGPIEGLTDANPRPPTSSRSDPGPPSATGSGLLGGPLSASTVLSTGVVPPTYTHRTNENTVRRGSPSSALERRSMSMYGGDRASLSSP